MGTLLSIGTRRVQGALNAHEAIRPEMQINRCGVDRLVAHEVLDVVNFDPLFDLLGHKDVSTTMIYTHVLNKGGRGVQSPEDMPSIGIERSGRGSPYSGGKGFGLSASTWD